MMGYCKVPECGRPTENPDTGLCATHSRAMRKIVSVPIKKVAEKMAKKLDAYAERRRAFLHNKRCAVYPHLKATEIHHMRGRVGALLLDQRYWLPVSTEAHVRITNNPKWAIKAGYSLPRLTELPKDTI
jgi:hypothetical protein